ncbi:DUF6660 family protein [Mucilaginibacter sp. P19]|uniref:DUF6660 family protein n=1 Tax=Mucilaginibacter sp. P19 TaxID=3423947 RepID=UPI003D66BD50
MFFLTLDLEPCKDTVGRAPNSFISSIFTKQHQSKPTQDQCPPMCHCNCCNMQVVIHSKMVFKPVMVTYTSIKVYMIPEKPVTRPANIWQPPKLNA